MRQVCILGSTGSIGESTLQVLAAHPDRYRVCALSAARNAQALLEQCRRFSPRFAVLAFAERADWLAAALAESGLPTQLLIGEEGLARVASLPEVDTVVAGIVGAAGLVPTLRAVQAGKRVLLANKEALVMSGELLLAAARESGAALLPVDSEHNALFQCLPAGFESGLEAAGVSELVLTASGGPFRDRPLAELARVTPAEACAHPNWDMGRKISVDSATMMNKGLEVIEAHWLFGAHPGQIGVCLHRESIVHSLVRYVDGSVLAQLGNPDMRTPIAHALAWPQRIGSGVAPLDLTRAGTLSFEPVDARRFPCLGLAYEALAAGGSACVVLNAANEVAVHAFLDGKLRFDRIHEIIARSLADTRTPGTARERPGEPAEGAAAAAGSLAAIIAADAAARRVAAEHVARFSEADAA